MSKLRSLVGRVLFGVAFVFAGLGVLEKVANFLGYTIMRSYSPWRLLEFAGITLLFVIALLLSEMCHIMAARPS
jgi:uncharacterized membrane protein YphA (DoxX/SURF4 family)